LQREDLVALHTTSLKSSGPATKPVEVLGDVESVLGLAVPGPEPFSLYDTPDLRALRPPPPPWVHAGEIDLPRLYEEGTVDSRPLELSPWALFADRLDYRRAALAFDSSAGHEMPLFYMPPPRETAVARKVKKIATERMFREIRRHLRRYWKSQFREHPSLDYSEYEARLIQINNIGKDPSEHDYFNVEYTTNELKQEFLRKDRTDAERDLPLLTWGPVTVNDSGSVKLDVGTVVNGDEEDISLDVGGMERRKPIVGNKSYEIDTSFITDINPFRGYTRGNSLAMVRRLGVEVKVDWLTDVLSRRVVSAELECTADLQGEYGVFANFVIHSR
jgi:hypothetical protein